MTTPAMNFHPSEWNFRAPRAAQRSTPDEVPLLRVEIHRGHSAHATPIDEGRPA